MTTRALLPLLPLLFAAACDPADGAFADGEVEFRCNPVVQICSPFGNTEFTGALNLSPLDTQGNLYKDIQVNQVTLAGGTVVLDDFWAYHGQLWGRVQNGTITTYYSGAQFAGAEFDLTAWGDPIILRILGVSPPIAPETHYWEYTFEWDDGSPGTHPVCIPAEPGGQVSAIVHENLDINAETGDAFARPNTVYIACLRGAAGEAAHRGLGYGFRPFQVGIAAFEGAMRFLRADYCGDGKTWTQYGETLTYMDKWGIANSWQGHTDAVWGLNGALCIGQDLRAGNTYDDVLCPGGPKPPLCDDTAAKALYYASGRIWSGIP